ncbi:MAG: hypothetical protein HY211_04215 [Candidatus Omnitrophica bacterium]|nr:hypothetical protein [Candidatus Omnitrophota bacterium]
MRLMVNDQPWDLNTPFPPGATVLLRPGSEVPPPAAGLEESRGLGIKIWWKTLGMWGPTHRALKQLSAQYSIDPSTRSELRGRINRFVKMLAERNVEIREHLSDERYLPAAIRALSPERLNAALDLASRLFSDQGIHEPELLWMNAVSISNASPTSEDFQRNWGLYGKLLGLVFEEKRTGGRDTVFIEDGLTRFSSESFTAALSTVHRLAENGVPVRATMLLLPDIARMSSTADEFESNLALLEKTVLALKAKGIPLEGSRSDAQRYSFGPGFYLREAGRRLKPEGFKSVFELFIFLSERGIDASDVLQYATNYVSQTSSTPEAFQENLGRFRSIVDHLIRHGIDPRPTLNEGFQESHPISPPGPEYVADFMETLALTDSLAERGIDPAPILIHVIPIAAVELNDAEFDSFWSALPGAPADKLQQMISASVQRKLERNADILRYGSPDRPSWAGGLEEQPFASGLEEKGIPVAGLKALLEYVAQEDVIHTIAVLAESGKIGNVTGDFPALEELAKEAGFAGGVAAILRTVASDEAVLGVPAEYAVQGIPVYVKKEWEERVRQNLIKLEAAHRIRFVGSAADAFLVVGDDSISARSDQVFIRTNEETVSQVTPHLLQELQLNGLLKAGSVVMLYTPLKDSVLVFA